jgi:hypothetical protein
VETGSRKEDASKYMIAFSSEVEAGSRKENASKQKSGASVLINQPMGLEDEKAVFKNKKPPDPHLKALAMVLSPEVLRSR